MSFFPASIVTAQNLTGKGTDFGFLLGGDSQQTVGPHAAILNGIIGELIAIESQLGVKTSPAAGTVWDALNNFSPTALGLGGVSPTATNPVLNARYAAANAAAGADIAPFNFVDNRTFSANQGAGPEAMAIAGILHTAGSINITNYDFLVVGGSTASDSGNATWSRIAGLRTHVDVGLSTQVGTQTVTTLAGVYNHVGTVDDKTTVVNMIGYEYYSAHLGGVVGTSVGLRIRGMDDRAPMSAKWGMQIGTGSDLGDLIQRPLKSQHMGDFGIGGAALTTAPRARLDVIAPIPVGSRMQTVALFETVSASGLNANPRHVAVQTTLRTTDATPTSTSTLIPLEVFNAASGIALFEARIVAHDLTAGTAMSTVIRADIGGAGPAVLDNYSALFSTAWFAAGMTAGFIAGSGNVLVQVAGVAGHDIRYAIYIDAYACN